MAAAMLAVLQDGKHAGQMGRQACQHVRDHYSRELQLSRLRTVLSRVARPLALTTPAAPAP